MDNEPYIPTVFAPGYSDPFYGKMSLFLSIDGKVYELIHENYKKMQEFVKKFEEEIKKNLK